MSYPGGKGSCFRHLINIMPPHETYIETHLGGGAVMRRKLPAARNIGIDADRSVIDEWDATRSRRLWFPIELHHADAVSWLRSYDWRGGELVYADPPYLHSTRRDLAIYDHEYTDDQHVELLQVLGDLPCYVVVSGYDSPLYRTILQHRYGWRRIEFPNTTRRGLVTEVAWFNYDPPTVLHDASYAGSDYRERERINRKRRRWESRFRSMPAAERQVILEALMAVAAAIAAPGGTAGNNVRSSGYENRP